MAGLGGFVAEFGWLAVLGAVLGFLTGGFVKGVVGFALPMVALSVNGSFLPYEVAVALLIVPTLVSNTFQSLRNGAMAAWGSLKEFWRLNLVLVVTIGISAQLVVRLPEAWLFGVLGVFITAFGLSQLGGLRLRFSGRNRGRVETAVALVGGVFGGLSGIWGPPVVMYLLASGVPKVAMVRAQSLSFLLGSIVLIGAHLRSGVLNAQTLPASAWLVLPTMAAMFAGYLVQDRLDQEKFRKATLAVLIIAGLNLLRRAVFG
ncbi:MAG TPA: sulfite exporter TauE/SafE family protein [Amaricoccus sp.]|uniref:sulfite exporter TauE/SafE family protein n=1 Tax=Amaricoccus sp. TaxID=1872485 RepID=UPI002B83EF3E|nr:sulfite exporter TauE/SafE family protein [Amaricoccus sp.]HMQ94024.1 sulfite exporter TauE/SafE family protein [Amaricoccus sp.]HMR53231.1 sulfite exporter TauE/SafE family protein [Amaricoccus sp.]HMR61115.1 sulfite exporter TauE/SafE family protein [Amaricoccus sp.]HMU00164.1 sulfite exporter TauE/SafE family protein [Amaricoccus sp.]